VPGNADENQNNHSLVTRVDFGSASFLVMGDLEVAGIETLADAYDDTPEERELLDADVLQVGHHGSYNATSHLLVNAVTPVVAVIPVGVWNFGSTGGSPFTTFAFGHLRQYTVELLEKHIARRRSQAKSVMVAERARTFCAMAVTKAIYANGWDGTVRVVARAEGGITVYRER
jgi:competence protein ComEC